MIIQRFSSLIISTLSICLLFIGCSEELEQDTAPLEQTGTWEFSGMQCDGLTVTFHDYTDILYISPTGFNNVVTASNCSASNSNGNYTIEERNMWLGGGQYSCNPNPCNFRYSFSINGSTYQSDTLICPNDFGTPQPVNTSTTPFYFKSSSQLTLTTESSGTTCVATYTKSSESYTPPTIEEPVAPPPPEPGDNPPYTLVSMVGESGNWVGANKSHDYTESTGTFTQLFAYPKTAYVRYTDSGSNGTWHFIFSGADGTKLTAGQYINATDAPYNDPGTPGLSIGGNGRGCTTSGNFTVFEIEYDVSDHPTKFAIDFDMYCDGGSETLSGSIRFNSIYQ